MRRAAIKDMNENKVSLATALLAARKDNEIRTKYFITPLALSARAENARGGEPGSRWQPDPTAETGLEGGIKRKRGGKGKTKKGLGKGEPGKGKGDQGKGRNSQSKAAVFRKALKSGKLFALTPDKRRICFPYNCGECTRYDCTCAHVCAKCFGSHPYGPECPKYEAA